MIKQTFDAVFENGVFRPLAPLDVPISEGQQVRLVMEAPESPEEILELAMHIYDNLSEEQIEEIEQIILNRRNFFGDRAP
jgi:predicted DNA-binding antitoxin AbrB/MazE fold protein